MNNFEREFVYEAPDPPEHPFSGVEALKVAFVGNPNCGKTTLFNDYTGAKLKTANWPGVTVEAKEGETRCKGKNIGLIDLPGIYSLTSYTQEEQIARAHIMEGNADVIVDVVDATQLERSLYLTLQLLELKKPVVVALNMMDIVAKRGIDIDTHRLSEVLGCPVIPVSARKREGLGPLMHACLHHAVSPQDPIKHFHAQKFTPEMQAKHAENVMVYSEAREEQIDALESRIQSMYPAVENTRWHAIKLLEHDAEVCGTLKGVETPNTNYEDVLISERYDFISLIMKECVFRRKRALAHSDAIDAVLTNTYASIPIFLAVMALVFLVTFVAGDAVKGLLEDGLDLLNGTVSEALLGVGAAPALVSLITDGIITGVGTILTFLPNIFILFCALGFLEDCGYMSRVAYVMDTLMSKVGLSGRACIPMILGFGCTVPAIMGTRALESNEDRKKVMSVLPFVSCSARLPIYILFAGLFFPQNPALVAFFLYVLGIAVALGVLVVFSLVKHQKAKPLLIELPDYKVPSAHTMWVFVFEKIKDYVLRAGTVIFIASIILWLLMNFGPSGWCDGDVSLSFAAWLGYCLVPVLSPFGAGDWRLAVALLAGISAKEVVVSSVSVLFGADVATTGSHALAPALAAIGFGPANALGFMVFCLLYVPCIATIGVLKSESKSAGFAFKVVLMQVAIAWIFACLVFHIAQCVLQ